MLLKLLGSMKRSVQVSVEQKLSRLEGECRAYWELRGYSYPRAPVSLYSPAHHQDVLGQLDFWLGVARLIGVRPKETLTAQ